MVMTDPIADPIDITDSPPPDISVEAQSRYEADMGTGYATWFKVQVANMFAAIDVWFETPIETASHAWQVVQDVHTGRIAGFDGAPTKDIQALAAYPPVVNLIFSKFVGRLQAATNARTQFMHQLMEGQLRNLAAVVNINATKLNNSIVVLESKITQQVSAERAQRESVERGILQAMQANLVQLTENLHHWTEQQIATPLLEAIGQQHKQITTETHLIVTDGMNHVLADVLPTLAALIAAQTATQSQVQTLNHESETCVQTMCKEFGPDGSISGPLRALQIAKWIAFLALLQGLGIKDLEQIAALIGAGAGTVGELVTSYVLDALEQEHS